MDSTDKVAKEGQTIDKTKSEAKEQEFNLETAKAFAKKNPLAIGKQILNIFYIYYGELYINCSCNCLRSGETISVLSSNLGYYSWRRSVCIFFQIYTQRRCKRGLQCIAEAGTTNI